jgi:hypothetical protein
VLKSGCVGVQPLEIVWFVPPCDCDGIPARSASELANCERITRLRFVLVSCESVAWSQFRPETTRNVHTRATPKIGAIYSSWNYKL